jgi:hypothetical protein
LKGVYRNILGRKRRKTARWDMEEGKRVRWRKEKGRKRVRTERKAKK